MFVCEIYDISSSVPAFDAEFDVEDAPKYGQIFGHHFGTFHFPSAEYIIDAGHVWRKNFGECFSLADRVECAMLVCHDCR